MKVIISGALGKMGRKVYCACVENNVDVLCGVDISEGTLSFPVYSSFDKIQGKADAIIDFSAPQTLNPLLEYAIKTNTPAVLCSTGYSEEDINAINKASKQIAIFRSANMSLGVNVLIELVKEASKKLYGFDIEIIEKHHNQKVDAPSGTALMLADGIKQSLPEKFYVYGREGKVGKRTQNEIGIHAIRGGNIVGEHQVIFVGNSETLTFTHEATDRSVFAIGAVNASKYIATKKVGLFDMNDLLQGK